MDRTELKRLVDELERLEAKATPGVWRSAITGDGRAVVVDEKTAAKPLGEKGITTIAECGPEDEPSKQDALFIAALRNNIKPLLNALKEMLEETPKARWYNSPATARWRKK